MLVNSLVFGQSSFTLWVFEENKSNSYETLCDIDEYYKAMLESVDALQGLNVFAVNADSQKGDLKITLPLLGSTKNEPGQERRHNFYVQRMNVLKRQLEEVHSRTGLQVALEGFDNI